MESHKDLIIGEISVTTAGYLSEYLEGQEVIIIEG